MLPRAEISTCDDLGAAPNGDVREQIKGESPRTGKSTMSEDSIRVEEAVRGKVKWFDASKGFGLSSQMMVVRTSCCMQMY